MPALDRFSYSRNGDNGHVDQNCQVHVHIPSIDQRGKHVAYQIRVTNIATRQSWDVARRFSEFLQVRNALLAYFKDKEGSKCPGCILYEKVLLRFEFPRKHMFTSVSPPVLNYRKVALRSFVALLASHTFTTKPKCPTCSGFAFTAVQDFLTTDLKPAVATAAAGASAEAAGATAVSSDAIRESIDVSRFTERHPISKMRTVDSNGKFTTGASTSSRKHHHHYQQPNHLAVSKPRPNAQKQPVNAKYAAGYDSDDARDLLSPPHSSTGSSSGSFGSAASPVAALHSAPTIHPPVRRTPAQTSAPPSAAASASEPVEDADPNGSFVSFTSGVARPKRSGSLSSSFVARRSSGAIMIKKKSEKKKLNFARRRTSSAAQHQSVDGDDADDDADADEDDTGDEINMDFLKPVAATHS